MVNAALISAKNNRGWILISVLILGVTAVSAYATPAAAGLISGCLWAILIVVPNIGNRKVDQLSAQQSFGQASKLAKFISLLHPADGWRERPELLRALELAQKGNIPEASAILNRYKSDLTPSGRSAIATLYQIEGRWEDLLLWIQDNLSSATLRKDFDILNSYLRALGEIGNLNGMLLTWERYEQTFEKILNIRTRNLARLFVFAFCGETEQVTKLLSSSLFNYSDTIKTFWLATADQSAGKDTIAREQFLNISDSSDLRIKKAVARRLSNPVVEAETVLTERSKQILSRISTEMESEARYSGRVGVKPRQAFATYFIIGLNLLVFGLEVKLGGSTNLESLYKLGALVPREVIAGDWWRLLAAAFLHYGFLHLALNMLGLYLFGRLVEFAIGLPRFLLLYFTSAIGSMLAVTFMSVKGYSQTNFAVGASGCIMGLVGAFAAILLLDWQRKKTRIAARSLRGIVTLIILQVIFDLTTPQISFVGHTSGLIVGFVMGILLKYGFRGRH
ncbi:rhomboid family intramembrane serine protease [Scytonema hofmannii PCC 7110]|uniref:Rhomboid family intramembrane serine protease n=2 Tax=Scytonema hofmannii TaxID=34078 RepID=A0A139XFR7_9CYAN|nr:rhomboid family intramembrane serine protease [Scytonema hofmannii PCC 7110]